MTSNQPALTLCRSDAALPDRSDDELMVLAAAGMLEAYGELVRRYQGAVRTAAAKLCGSRSLGDDVTQDVFVQLWRSRTTYNAVGKFRGYLFTLVRNACRKSHRRVRETQDEGAATLLPSAAPGPLDELIATQRRRRIRAALDKLPCDQREAIVLRFDAGLDYSEVAQMAKRSEATIRSRVFLGLARLRRSLGKGNEP